MTWMRCTLFCLFLVLPFAGCDSGEAGKAPANAHGSSDYRDSSRSSLSENHLAALRDSLIVTGDYECCTRPGCFECAEWKGRCHCYADIRKKDPICGQCLDGYRKGEGKLKLVSIPELERIGEKKTR
jgi:hypothetical protein